MSWIQNSCNKKSCCESTLRQVYSLLCNFFTSLKRRFIDGVVSFSNYADITPTGIVVSSQAVRIEDLQIFNSAAVPQYVKLYNKGATLPTAADDSVEGVLVRNLLVPALSGENLSDLNIPFPQGLSIRGVTSGLDGAVGAPVANSLLVNIGYKFL